MIDCMACMVAGSRCELSNGPTLILEGITHATYENWVGKEQLTCRFDKKFDFRVLWYDAVIRAMRGLRPRPAVPPSMIWKRFSTSFRKLAKSSLVWYGP